MSTILHTMLRVKNLDKSIEFYTQVVGMEMISRHDNEVGKYTIAFLAFAEDNYQTQLELTYNWGVDSYHLGDAYGHIAIGVADVAKTFETITKKGFGHTITRAAGPVKGGRTIIGFLEDPDGYDVEYIQRTKNEGP